MDGLPCGHAEIRCLNEYELIRKYQCESCGLVMMCACDEAIGHMFRPHQLSRGVESATQRRVTVPGGFRKGICRECRGLPLEPHPMAELHGHTSKIKRFYWRELTFRKLELFGKWAEAHGVSVTERHSPEARIAREKAEEQALREIKAFHAATPKYSFAEESQQPVIDKFGIQVIDLPGTYVKGHEEKRVRLLDQGQCISVEEFVSRYFKQQGYSVLFLESRPFHVLFGIYMWLLVQDPDDPLNRMVMFGDRDAYEAGGPNKPIWMMKPDDFGTPGYGVRRAAAIEEHLRDVLRHGELEELFKYWLQPSETLRQYLWAHKLEDIDIARELTRILPKAVVGRILRYLVEAYWQRYTGWPDLLIHRGADYLFVEVKSSKDKLSQDQKNWIRGNHESLHLPFKIVKVHKKEVV